MENDHEPNTFKLSLVLPSGARERIRAIAVSKNMLTMAQLIRTWVMEGIEREERKLERKAGTGGHAS